ncbi:uncharacterized protein LOC110842250 isoform X2 [Folsomia candida]|uniref:uncharacterized protein LOC110842250 isoform X2 n=1 Tax=Folsomia candida TaxID=158441 RepID=UPI0016050933|nr:uncharacterized protein LOC110842250 isoform X2 [Folsomia candida]
MRQQLKNLTLILISIFAVVFITPPIFVLVILPLMLYRKVIIFLASWKKDIYRPLNICSGALVFDDIYGKPISSECVVTYLRDVHDTTQLIAKLEKAVQIHPELTCILHSWMSTLFWKKSSTFQLAQHITVNEEPDPEKIQQFLDSLPEQPFTKGFPLWEVISLPNYSNSKYDTKSALVWRFHHILADGLAIISFFNDFFDFDNSGKEMKSRENFPNLRPSKVTRIDSNPIKDQVRSAEMTRYQDLIAIDMADLKRICRTSKANITVLMFAGVTGALMKAMKERGRHICQDATSGYVMPSIFQHDGTLTNNLIAVPLRIPLSEAKLEQRLDQISNQFRHLFSSTIVIGFFLTNRALGLFGGTVRKYPEISKLGTVMHSNVAIFRENRFQLFGNPVERISPITGLIQKSCPIAIINLSYNGKMGITITADKAVFSGRDQLERVINDVICEINEIGRIPVHGEEVEMSLV